MKPGLWHGTEGGLPTRAVPPVGAWGIDTGRQAASVWTLALWGLDGVSAQADDLPVVTIPS
ncbi:hypothetical protein JXA88_13610, partial [Candidatus Fermentibacteria bacterium]|nr:hypothetical protein [Candidatus Fermentibacteria bacterium]